MTIERPSMNGRPVRIALAGLAWGTSAAVLYPPKEPGANGGGPQALGRGMMPGAGAGAGADAAVGAAYGGEYGSAGGVTGGVLLQGVCPGSFPGAVAGGPAAAAPAAGSHGFHALGAGVPGAGGGWRSQVGPPCHSVSGGPCAVGPPSLGGDQIVGSPASVGAGAVASPVSAAGGSAPPAGASAERARSSFSSSTMDPPVVAGARRIGPEELRRHRPFGGAPPGAPRAQRPLTISTISSPASVGLLPTLTPASVRASILAAAVPLPPDTMAPAWPIFLPGGAVTPAM
ncbi:MAG: hypothetical protein JWM89_585 [Acidimicrobiales bacterium]|nr:hypothetical protein [Acidimicrobiales bacterium]